MARKILTGGNGSSGQTGQQVIDDINSNFDQLYAFNVEEYGAVHDLKTVLDGAINSGSAILTSASNQFLSSDVGKRIIVSRAGAANAPLRTTIASFQSAGQVTLSVTASSTVTNQMVDWGTDDTVAIQNAIIDAFNAGSATIYLPAGRYMIDGDLQTSISGTNPNSQLYIPSVADSATNNASIRLVGESTFPWLSRRLVMETKGTILKSTRIGSGVNPTMLGTIGTTGNYLNFNYTKVTVENIALTVYTNNNTSAPSMHGIDFRYLATGIFKNVSITIDVPFLEGPDASGAEFAGLIIGGRDNNGPNYLETCCVAGFKYSYVLGEHTTVNNLYAFAASHGYVIPRQNYYVVGHVMSHYCANQLLFPASQIMGLDHDDTKFSRVNLTFEIESDTNINGTTHWWDTATFIIDSDNISRGSIDYLYLQGGVIRNDVAAQGITGANNIELIPSDGFQVVSANVGANTNNYQSSISEIANIFRLNPSGAFNLTGIVALRLRGGAEITIINTSASNTLTIKTEDANSTAANRFLMNADLALLPNAAAKFKYDVVSSRWRRI